MSDKHLREVKPNKNIEQAIKNNRRAPIKSFNNIYEALLKFDTEAAIDFIKQPDLINPSYAETTSYILHAILLLLPGQDWTKTLNQMTDSQITSLKKTLKNTIWPTKAPDVEAIENNLRHILGYQQNENLNHLRVLKDIDHLQDEDALHAKTCFVEMRVAEFWDDTTKEMQNLSEALDSFERESAEKEPVVNCCDKTQELWDSKQLAEKLGYHSVNSLFTMKSLALKNCPELKDEVKSWFTSNGRLFLSEYFEKLKKLLSYANLKNVEKSPANEDTNQTPKFDLLDMKAFSAYLEGLQKIIDERDKKMEHCDELIAKATEAKNFSQRKQFLEQAASVNSFLEKSQQQFQYVENALKNGKQLLRKQKEALKMLKSINAEITEFMNQPKLY